MSFLTQGGQRRNLAVLGRLLLVFVGLVTLFTIGFHFLMAYEGQQHRWVTGVYWTLVMMLTLGFGDITFSSDLGWIF